MASHAINIDIIGIFTFFKHVLLAHYHLFKFLFMYFQIKQFVPIDLFKSVFENCESTCNCF